MKGCVCEEQGKVKVEMGKWESGREEREGNVEQDASSVGYYPC